MLILRSYTELDFKFETEHFRLPVATRETLLPILIDIGHIPKEAWYQHDTCAPIVWDEASWLHVEMQFPNIAALIEFKLRALDYQVVDLNFDTVALKMSTFYEIEDRKQFQKVLDNIANDIRDAGGNPSFEITEEIETFFAFRDQTILDHFQERCIQAGVTLNFIVRPISTSPSP